MCGREDDGRTRESEGGGREIVGRKERIGREREQCN